MFLENGTIDTYYDLKNPKKPIARFRHVANGGYIESGRNLFDNFRILLRYTWSSVNITRESDDELLPYDDTPETVALWEELEEDQQELRTIGDAKTI